MPIHHAYSNEKKRRGDCETTRQGNTPRTAEENRQCLQCSVEIAQENNTTHQEQYYSCYNVYPMPGIIGNASRVMQTFFKDLVAIVTTLLKHFLHRYKNP